MERFSWSQERLLKLAGQPHLEVFSIKGQSIYVTGRTALCLLGIPGY